MSLLIQIKHLNKSLLPLTTTNYQKFHQEIYFCSQPMTRLILHILLLYVAHFPMSMITGDGKKNDQQTLTPFIPAYNISTDSPVCVIPFSRAGNLIVIKARVDSVEGNFILDTGAPGLILNRTYFRDYPSRDIHNEEQIGITGTSGVIVRTDIKNFNLGTFNYSKIEADLANLGHIENSKNIRILGLVGLEFFKQCEMFIDFDRQQIHLKYITKKHILPVSQMLEDVSAYRVIPIDLMDNRIVATTELGGKKLKMIIDCAAESNILNSKLPNKLLEYVTISRRVKLTGSGSTQLNALYGNISELTIGNEKIGDLPVLLTNLENTCFAYNGCIDGVLGFDFLSLHKIGFNFVTRKMYIWK